jgi:hypothetical protein
MQEDVKLGSVAHDIGLSSSADSLLVALHHETSCDWLIDFCRHMILHPITSIINVLTMSWVNSRLVHKLYHMYNDMLVSC